MLAPSPVPTGSECEARSQESEEGLPGTRDHSEPGGVCRSLGEVPGEEQTGVVGVEGTASIARCDPPVCKIAARSKTAPGEQLEVGALLSAPRGDRPYAGATLQGHGALSVLAAQSWGAPPAPALLAAQAPLQLLTYPGPGSPQLVDSHGPFHDVSLPGKAFRRCPYD